MVHCCITRESNYTPREDITLLLLRVNLIMANLKLFATLCKLTINVAGNLGQEGKLYLKAISISRSYIWARKAAVYSYIAGYIAIEECLMI